MRQQASTHNGIASKPPTGIGKSFFHLPKFARDQLLTSSSLPHYLTLFALYYKFARENKGKPRLINSITVAEIGKLIGQNTNETESRESIQKALKLLRQEKVIDYRWIPSRCEKEKRLKSCETMEQVTVSYYDEINEVKENNHHAAIVFCFSEPPLTEKFEINEKKQEKRLDRIRENNSISLPIPSNLCHTVREIVQRTKASRSALSLHKLALYVSTITNLPKIKISIVRLNEIIGYKSQSKGKTYNINVISNLLEQLVSSGFIKGFEKQDMTNPTYFEISFVTEPKKGKSENIKGNKGTVRNKAGKKVVKVRVESQAGGHKNQVLNAFAPEREGFNNCKPIKPILKLKQQVREAAG